MVTECPHPGITKWCASRRPSPDVTRALPYVLGRARGHDMSPSVPNRRPEITDQNLTGQNDGRSEIVQRNRRKIHRISCSSLLVQQIKHPVLVLFHPSILLPFPGDRYISPSHCLFSRPDQTRLQKTALPFFSFTPPSLSLPYSFPQVSITSLVLRVNKNLPLPLMIPSLPRRRLHQCPARILNRHALESIHALLQHRHTVQIPDLPGAGALGVAQLLARVGHALVLLHQDALALLALLAAEQKPSAVDRPVPQVSVAAEPEGGRDALG